jgi:hypothetical protein
VVRKGRNYFGDTGIDGKIILKSILQKQDERVWIALNWVSIGCNGRLL